MSTTIGYRVFARKRRRIAANHPGSCRGNSLHRQGVDSLTAYRPSLQEIDHGRDPDDSTSTTTGRLIHGPQRARFAEGTCRGRSGKFDDDGRPGRCAQPHRQEDRNLPSRTQSRTLLRDEGRCRGRRLCAGRTDDRHQSAFHGRLSCDRRRTQFAGSVARQPHALGPRTHPGCTANRLAPIVLDMNDRSDALTSTIGLRWGRSWRSDSGDRSADITSTSAGHGDRSCLAQDLAASASARLGNIVVGPYFSNCSRLPPEIRQRVEQYPQ